MVYSLRENAGMFGSLVYCVGSKSTVWGMVYCAESRPTHSRRTQADLSHGLLVSVMVNCVGLLAQG